MSFFIVLIIIFLLLMLLRSAWMKRFMARKAAEMLQRSFGIDPKDEKQRRKRESRKPAKPQEPIIPKEYAVDVEFVEIKEFESTTIERGKDGSETTTTVTEQQITDVEWEEIKQ